MAKLQPVPASEVAPIQSPPTMQPVRCDRLKLNPKNTRTHSDAQIEKLARTIAEFGFLNPVVIDRDNCVIAGHGRIMAARKLGMETVPAILADHLTEEQKRTQAIADNRLAELAGWDDELLAIELADLSGVEFGIDVTLTGFDLQEINCLIDTINEDEIDEDPPTAILSGPVMTSKGDLWKIGRHCLLCGDALDDAAYKRVLDHSKAAAVFTDPPYNVPIHGHVSGLGRRSHREFAMASGEMSQDQFTGLLKDVLHCLGSNSKDGSLHYICMDWRHMRELMEAGERAYTELKNLCVWVKTNAGMGSFYRSQHELVFVYKSGTGRHVNNVALGKHGRNRTNVWSFAGANSFSATRDDDLGMHPTVKPLGLVREAIKDSTNRGDIVLDPFAGSGTTLVAAHQTGRIGAGIEIDPVYCDVILRRLEEATGEQAVHAVSSLTFSDMHRVLA